MISVFFPDSNPLSIVGNIDDTRTINPRGKQFKDSGGYGMINFKNKKNFFDLSENTGLPYIFHIKVKILKLKLMK